MADSEEFTRLALALPGAAARPHFDRTAFVARITFATLAPDGLSANLKLTPEHQAFKVMLAPAIYAPVPGGWGRMGWTTMTLAEADEAEIADALAFAHALAVAKPPGGRRRRPG